MNRPGSTSLASREQRCVRQGARNVQQGGRAGLQGPRRSPGRPEMGRRAVRGAEISRRFRQARRGDQGLETFKTGNGDHYTYFECVRMLGELYLEKKDFLKSRTQFERSAKPPQPTARWRRKIALGRIAQARGKATTPSPLTTPSSPCRPPIPPRKHSDSTRRSARERFCWRSRKRRRVKLLDEVIEKSAADDTRIQAEAWVRKGDALRSKNSDLEALLAYLHVEVLFSAEKAQHAEALFNCTNWPPNSVNRPRRRVPREAGSRLPQQRLDPNSLRAPAEGPVREIPVPAALPVLRLVGTVGKWVPLAPPVPVSVPRAAFGRCRVTTLFPSPHPFPFFFANATACRIDGKGIHRRNLRRLRGGGRSQNSPIAAT